MHIPPETDHARLHTLHNSRAMIFTSHSERPRPLPKENGKQDKNSERQDTDNVHSLTLLSYVIRMFT